MLCSDCLVSVSNCNKIVLMCDVDVEGVINMVDLLSIYDILLMFNE